MKRLIEKTIYFLLMIITLLAITACVLRFVGFDNYIVVSGSMEPNIPTGSFAVVNRNVDFDDVKIGDVIVFKYEEMNIIHRVIETTTIKFWMIIETEISRLRIVARSLSNSSGSATFANSSITK